ncbi:hypothetical protein [Nitratireductor indicus]|uniref:hypothetical protein n=1 Tax=Nitratireductor indicus TaxID=721133 RepID=UPI0028749250|nr:hypothetical protein [Nitratireductor indicus]MDS1138229.1 hypothetical protein [Nitratireductor indicus]
MSLQNRVDPFGAIEAVSARGLFTGNRGVIHDPDTKTLLKRRWTTKTWIVCNCSFRDRRRDVMGRNARSGNAGWTELFFLDEVTALAAGHRPCFYCRRPAALAFLKCFSDAFRIDAPKVTELDKRLHEERRASGGAVPTISNAQLAGLPDGAMVAVGKNAFALQSGRALPWSFETYGKPLMLTQLPAELDLLTPPTTVVVLRSGYQPVWHPSATGA